MANSVQMLARFLASVTNPSTDGATAVEKQHFDPDSFDVMRDGGAFTASGKYEPIGVMKSDNWRGHKIVSARVDKVAIMLSSGLPATNADGSVRMKNVVKVTFADFPETTFQAWEGRRDEPAPARDLNLENLHFFGAKYFDADTNRFETAQTMVNGKYVPTVYCLDSEPKARD